MKAAQVDAYLRRMGVPQPAWPTVDVLRELQLRHLQTIPFENLSIHLGEEIVLEEKRLLDKVVGARRGGFCYELNGAFGALLAALGYDVSLLAARVYGEGGRLGIPYDHLALRVRTVDAGEWLADVGFGALSHYPLAFQERREQLDPGGVFRIAEAGPDAAGVRGAPASGGGTGVPDLDLVRDGKPVYRLDQRPRVLGDFVSGAWWHSTSAESHFVQSLVCSRITEDGGRITLSGRQLKVTAADGTRDQRELGTDEEVLEVYRKRFGIELDRVPVVRGAAGWAGAAGEVG
ncbi:arylamine N-acetyltransferase family protein [Streptomyces chromofuscus]|uniref:Arylamine N-acetyltransferase n=1 Tax=Streptomyces chromofuscus TaxID=42881 RepID=A0A7M2TDN0_STRCW|nr:arylamine N-acetyltransferase [Streptomyces chromofuscus]QOV46612.1 arylamine N-acetyltransferase [Streptomyces chromofuscus]GGT08152.1 N-hydroxyarylamine O-acetyltransferase [Streptomyces chromofuscus]